MGCLADGSARHPGHRRGPPDRPPPRPGRSIAAGRRGASACGRSLGQCGFVGEGGAEQIGEVAAAGVAHVPVSPLLPADKQERDVRPPRRSPAPWPTRHRRRSRRARTASRPRTPAPRPRRRRPTGRRTAVWQTDHHRPPTRTQRRGQRRQRWRCACCSHYEPPRLLSHAVTRGSSPAGGPAHRGRWTASAGSFSR